VRSHAKAASVGSTHRENRTSSLGVIAAMLVCAAAFLGIGAPAASAAPEAGPGWGFQSSLGLPARAPIGGLGTPIAIDSHGNIVQSDQEINAHTPMINIYNPSGELLTQINSLEAGVWSHSIAIDTSTDVMYVDTIFLFGSGIKRFTSDGKATPTYTLDPSYSVPQGDAMAVDPTTQDLLVTEPGAEAVQRYHTSGTLVETISTPSINPSWILVMPDGSFWTAPSSGPDLTHFSGTGTVLGTIADVGTLHGLSYDPVRELITASVENQFVTYSPAGARLAASPAKSDTGSGTVVAPTGLLYEHTSEGINVYTPGISPGVETPTISNVAPTSFRVSVEIDPGAGPPPGSTMHFEYTSDGEHWLSLPDQAVNAASTYEANINNVEANRQHQVRAVVENDIITKVTDSVEVTTPPAPPAVATSPASEVTETSAILNGTLNPFGLPATYHFEYGETTSYGSRVPAAIDAAGGSGYGVKFFSRTITGLTPGTTYHFRLVGANSLGTAEGSDRTFTTVAAGEFSLRAYEQVTAPEKNGGAIIPRLSVQAADDGNGFAYTTKAGSQSSPIITRAVAIRGSSDWKGKIDTDPPLIVDSGAFLIHPTIAVSDDFTHALVVSNQALTAGSIATGANIYRVNLETNAYDLIGSSNAGSAFNSFAGASSTDKFQAGAPDFSWVIFSSQPALLPGAPTNALYRWSEADGLEVASVLPNGEMSSAHRGQGSNVYDMVSADGSRIYFGAFGGAEEGVFLREGGGAPTPVSVPHVPGDPTTVQPATLLGTNADGRYAFLSSATRLTSDAPGEEGDLYRYDASDDSLEYLGARAWVSGGIGIFDGSLGIGEDGNTFYFDVNVGVRGNLTVWHDGVVHEVAPYDLLPGEERMSPNGRYFVFGVSVGSTPGVIQLYDAETEELSCVSCLPDGTPAQGSLAPGGSGDVLFSNGLPTTVTDSGTVYFDTTARLVAKDVNGTRDVYAYRDGSVTLISPGNAPIDAIYADVSPDDSNVFFTTAQKLVGRDNDESIDIYDARLNGGLPAQSPPPPLGCLRDDCKATPNPGPELPFGGSEALSGPENVKPGKRKVTCGKGKRKVKVKGKVKCIKKHKAGKNKKGGNR
jgi:hypothetical protein